MYLFSMEILMTLCKYVKILEFSSCYAGVTGEMLNFAAVNNVVPS